MFAVPRPNRVIVIYVSTINNTEQVVVINYSNHLFRYPIPFIFVYSTKLITTLSAIDRVKGGARILVRSPESFLGELPLIAGPNVSRQYEDFRALVSAALVYIGKNHRSRLPTKF